MGAQRPHGVREPKTLELRARLDEHASLGARQDERAARGVLAARQRDAAEIVDVPPRPGIGPAAHRVDVVLHAAELAFEALELQRRIETRRELLGALGDLAEAALEIDLHLDRRARGV